MYAMCYVDVKIYMILSLTLLDNTMDLRARKKGI